MEDEALPRRRVQAADPAADGLGSPPVSVPDEDPTVVPAALNTLMESAVAAVRAIEANGFYAPEAPVRALEVTTAALHRICGHIEPYVGDYSPAGARSARDAMRGLWQARALFSDSRHHLVLDATVDGDEPFASVAAPARPAA